MQRLRRVSLALGALSIGLLLAVGPASAAVIEREHYSGEDSFGYPAGTSRSRSRSRSSSVGPRTSESARGKTRAPSSSTITFGIARSTRHLTGAF